MSGENHAPKLLHAREVAGVEGNARLTAAIAAIIFILLAVEGVTILQVGPLLIPHVFIGVLMIPVVVLKIGTTTWRFAKYYLGDEEYRRKGAPPIILRMLGPALIALTIIVLGSGIGLVLLPQNFRDQMFFFHKVSFILWFIAMTIHVLGHVVETATLAPRDWVAHTRRDVARASTRQWVLVWGVAVGIPLAMLITSHTHYVVINN
ncbi:MAG: hypothetical protein WCK12_01985 [Acidimicrobiaceae bacterium]|jgi:hypothetical protein